MSKLFIFIITANLIIFSKVSAQGTEKKLCFREECFSLELAVTRQEREQGLMFRKSLDPDKGMLFIFSQEQAQSFWMKNTYIPLDIIWISRNKEVVFIEENVQPCLQNSCPVLAPDKKALYVLELNAGIVKDIGLQIGDELKF